MLGLAVTERLDVQSAQANMVILQKHSLPMCCRDCSIGYPPKRITAAIRGDAVGAVRDAIGSVFGFRQGPDDCGKLNYFQTGWTIEPVVTPTHNNVTSIERMAVISEVPAFEFKFNSNQFELH